MIDQRLKEAALAGGIDAFYALLREDAGLLDRVNEVPFIDTPLHIAACRGHIEFAMEIMNLKPSFVTKQNQDGFTPMHLDAQNDQSLMLLWLLDVDEDLVRIKGRGGMTPLHCLAARGDLTTLAEICSACPQSIKDVTNQGNTALHIAAENNHVETLLLLIGWLRRSDFIDSSKWEREISNWKNRHGNTLLHIAALKCQHMVVKELMKMFTHIQTNIKNSDGLTAMDILRSQPEFNERDIKISKIKLSYLYDWWGIFPRAISPVKLLTSRVSFCEAFTINFSRKWIQRPDEYHSIILVVDVLIATVTYQAALSPPGGFWQGSADVNSSIRNII